MASASAIAALRSALVALPGAAAGGAAAAGAAEGADVGVGEAAGAAVGVLVSVLIIICVYLRLLLPIIGMRLKKRPAQAVKGGIQLASIEYIIPFSISIAGPLLVMMKSAIAEVPPPITSVLPTAG